MSLWSTINPWLLLYHHPTLVHISAHAANVSSWPRRQCGTHLVDHCEPTAVHDHGDIGTITRVCDAMPTAGGHNKQKLTATRMPTARYVVQRSAELIVHVGGGTLAGVVPDRPARSCRGHGARPAHPKLGAAGPAPHTPGWPAPVCRAPESSHVRPRRAVPCQGLERELWVVGCWVSSCGGFPQIATRSGVVRGRDSRPMAVVARVPQDASRGLTDGAVVFDQSATAPSVRREPWRPVDNHHRSSPCCSPFLRI